MKNFGALGKPSALVAALLVANVAQAQEASLSLAEGADGTGGGAPEEGPVQHPVELGLFAGALFPPGNHSLREPGKADQDFGDIAPDFGVRFGLYPLAYIGVEGEAAVMPTQTDDDESANLFGLRAHAILQLPTRYVTPFLVVGGGRLFSDSKSLGEDSDAAFHFGIGAKIPLSNSLALRVDARDNITPSQLSSETPHWPEVLLGLSFGLGGAKEAPPPPPPPPADTDADGLTDDQDRCPLDPADTKDGCPILDQDGDGVLDPDDHCPNEAGTLANGCPDLDPDNDGLPVPDDKCPDVAGVAPDGCPDLDPDKDGIPVPDDKCPEEPETVNTYQDTDGCPDEVPEKVKAFTGVIKGINFDTGKARIRPGSYALLDRAAAVLTEFTDLRLHITGYTDSVGNRDKNLKLSEERAAAVKTYLVSKGLDESRLETSGKGPDNPIADNATRAGRQENRRIEFKIVK